MVTCNVGRLQTLLAQFNINVSRRVAARLVTLGMVEPEEDTLFRIVKSMKNKENKYIGYVMPLSPNDYGQHGMQLNGFVEFRFFPRYGEDVVEVEISEY